MPSHSMLTDKAREILRAQFKSAAFYSLWLERWPRRGGELNLYVQVAPLCFADAWTSYAKLCFENAEEELARLSSAPRLRFYGLVDRERTQENHPLGPKVEQVLL